MSIQQMYKLTCEIQRPTRTRGTQGDYTEVYTTIQADIPCSIRAFSGRERPMSGTKGVMATHRLYMDVPATIEPKDIIVIGTDEYEIDFPDNWARRGHHMQIDLIRRDKT